MFGLWPTWLSCYWRILAAAAKPRVAGGSDGTPRYLQHQIRTGPLSQMRTSRYAIIAALVIATTLSLPALASAKDEWLQVRSKNFNLIGNASERDLRRVGTRLEQFRETFGLFFGSLHVTSPIPTNVVVFKSDSAYKPFKPKKPDGKIDDFISGYFMPGDDVNYITLSTQGDDAEVFGTIFHEYVHFIVNTNFGKTAVPPWFNEGLAEYYQTFTIENDQNVKLGLYQNAHVRLLQLNQLIPLESLFSTSNEALLQSGNHSRSMFYAESWALIHYLVQAGKSDGLARFLAMVLKHTPPEEAFKTAFQTTYAGMERELRSYVEQKSFTYHLVALKTKVIFDADMRVAPLPLAETDAYLGDLLFHIHRADDAEPYLRAALSLKPDLSVASATLGMVKIRQKKYDEAKTLLEKAIAQDQTNHLAFYRYAYLLSREGRDEFGLVSSFSRDQTEKMRDALKKAIALNPTFAESYDLLAFVCLVNNEFLDEAVAYLQKALVYQPGNQRYAMRIAEIYARQGKFAEASAIADKIAATSDEPATRSQAERLIAKIKLRKEAVESYRETKKQNGRIGSDNSGPAPDPIRGTGDKQPTPEEIDALQDEAFMQTMNAAMTKPEAGEMQVIGTVAKIDCRRGITYQIKAGTETFNLTSKDFQALKLNAFVPQGAQMQLGCGADISSLKAVIIYRPATVKGNISRGELTGITFVPANFRFVDPADNRGGEPLIYDEQFVRSPGTASEPDMRERQRQSVIKQIRDALLKPQAGEKRDIGFIESSECSEKGTFFTIKTSAGPVRLSTTQEKLIVHGFTPDIEDVQVACDMHGLGVPVVFIYKDAPDAKKKTLGHLISLEFVPKAFTLAP